MLLYFDLIYLELFVIDFFSGAFLSTSDFFFLDARYEIDGRLGVVSLASVVAECRGGNHVQNKS